MLTNDVVSFEQSGPDTCFRLIYKQMLDLIRVHAVYRNFYVKYNIKENIHQETLKLEMDSSKSLGWVNLL